MAAAHTELPHFTMHNLMVSNVHAGDEGWKWIDVLGDNVCEDPEDGVFYPGTNNIYGFWNLFEINIIFLYKVLYFFLFYLYIIITIYIFICVYKRKEFPYSITFLSVLSCG